MLTTTMCVECDKNILEENVFLGVEKEPYCHDCYRLSYRTCPRCDAAFYRRDGVHVDATMYCKACADAVTFKCHACHVTFLKETGLSSHTNTNIVSILLCPTCFPIQTGECQICHERYVVAYLKSQRGFEKVCPDCYEEDAVSYLKKHIYTDKKGEWELFNSNLKDIEKDPRLYFGLEVEYRFYHETLSTKKKLQEITNQFIQNKVAYCKPDGSVDIEYNFLPSPKGDLFQKIDFFFEKILPEHIFKIDDNCGIHVHIPEKFINRDEYRKLLYFINHPEHDAFITHIADRSATGYCQRKAKDVSETESNGKYHSVACRKDKHTYEFRLFKSSLSAPRVRSYIEFICSLVAWLPTVKPKELTLENWYAHIQGNKEDYKNLILEKFEKDTDFEKMVSLSRKTPRKSDVAGGSSLSAIPPGKWRSFYGSGEAES